MTPLPKRRHSTRRGGKRKAAIKYSNLGLTVCPQCKTLRMAHRVCGTCGYYDGKEIIKQKVKKTTQK